MDWEKHPGAQDHSRNSGSKDTRKKEKEVKGKRKPLVGGKAVNGEEEMGATGCLGRMSIA